MIQDERCPVHGCVLVTPQQTAEKRDGKWVTIPPEKPFCAKCKDQARRASSDPHAAGILSITSDQPRCSSCNGRVMPLAGCCDPRRDRRLVPA